ncbi:putative ornithine carbamoyltransferase [Yersinia rohdei]|uniref:Ornithine carbamoyltransferase n=2 Tax=Yersinia rohdei TaxID=29485 RepID=A0ABM5SCV4_YERRO|nr:SinI family autotransporter-associated protein [Yersinia rohdei]EEQ01522.1 Ornithine carbamoyltransferase [Yersinia rohdei ATCC 43380]AJJ10903.1 putative ornithine carbamoyltransferase [Yersinia rohdei]CNE87404.1 intimin-like protein SinH [Yersinia rohdei]CNI85106.1 intimin-like protein SinH [Yersinia rohdei]CQJ49969.1 intimin-like protein SinH [Yersinia rohdei]
MNMNFTVNKRVLVLALALAGCSAGSLWAASTPTTAPVKGSAPVLSAPSNGAVGAVDFSGTYATEGKLSTGDTLVMTYQYNDSDGDLDASLTTVTWSYLDDAGQSVTIPATNAPAAASGSNGTSTITIPAGATGTRAISVTLTEYSATGDPLRGNVITVTDTSTGGAGGGTTTPPGPVTPGADVAGGIFLQSDSPAAGSGATDYARSAAHPQVGETYVFRAWDDSNGNGVWDAGEANLTATLGSIQWQLDGSNATANGNSTLSNHAISGATSDSYTVPVNSASSSGATPGDQGFSLKVDFN